MKKLLVGLGVAIVLLVTAVVALPVLIPSDTIKEQISAQVRDATGRELRIDGEVSFSLVPDIEFSASDLSLSNAAGMTDPEMFSLGGITVKIGLLPLLGREVVIDTLVIRDPVLHLGIDKEGRPNWAFKPANAGAAVAGEAPVQKTAELPISDLRLGDVRIEKGLVSFKNASTGQILQAKDIELKVALADLGSPLSLTGRLILNDEPVTLDLSVKTPRDLLTGKSAAIQTALVTKHLTTGFDAKIQQQPVPGLDGAFRLDIASVGKLAAWLGQPLDKAQPDPGPLKLRATFSGDGAKVALKQATIEGKELKAKAAGSFDGSKAIPRFKSDIEIMEANLNAYLPAPAAEKKAPAKPKTGKQRPGGWSEEPLDFSPLSKANGDIDVKIGTIRYKDLLIQNGRIRVSIANGVLTTSIEQLKLAEGTISATAKIDASKPAAVLDYQASITGVEARKLLKTFADNDRLSGKANFQTRGKARGRTQKELVESLNGDGRFKFIDGAIHGINLAATLRKAKTLGIGASGGEAQKTDFAELSGSFTIKNGLLENRDFKMLAPLIRLSGTGVVPLPPQQVDYLVTAKLVASIKGQGGGDALAGLPIPIKVKGPWSNVGYGVDWKSVFSKAMLDPERLKNMPTDLRDSAKGFGVDLPALKMPGTEGIFKGIPGLPQGSGSQEGPTAAKPSGETGSAVEQLKGLIQPKQEQPVEQPKEQEAPVAPDPLKSLKGLFGK